MYERFTDRSRKVLHLAHQEAQLLNHGTLGTEHVLLGLVKEGSGVAAHVLKNMEVSLERIREEVLKIAQAGPPMTIMGKLPQTPRTRKMFAHAIAAASELKHNYVGTEHLLLGMLREGEGVACQVLLALGVKLDAVKEETLNLLGVNVNPQEFGPHVPMDAAEIEKTLNKWAMKVLGIVSITRASLETEADSFHVVKEGGELVDGVGVLFYPEQVRHAKDAAAFMAHQIRKGTVIGLPSTRGPDGNYLWDFKIVGGDPGQVEVRRSDSKG